VELSESYQNLLARLGDLSPIRLLSGSSTQVENLENLLEAKHVELTQMHKLLIHLLTENQNKLDSLLPDEPTVAGFKALLREALDDQWGKPMRDTLQVLKKRLQAFGKLIEMIKEIAFKLQIPFTALTIIPEKIDLIGETLIEAKNKITKINLNFLEDELQDVLDAAINQLESIDPAQLLTDLDLFYQNSLTALSGLYPEEAIQNLDGIFQDVILAKISTLHPQKTVAEPLEDAFEKILELLEMLDITKIFAALIGGLNSIEQELDEGLERTAAAFNELLAALPSISVSAGV
ncbi:MAG: hypothetical protein DWQ04_27080, partial [Chloroflexi bacterium]